MILGDILICDNVFIYSGRDIEEILNTISNLFQIKLMFLPAYSPELNPTELVFSKVKLFLTQYRTLDSDNLISDIAFAFASITHNDIISFYKKCYL